MTYSKELHDRLRALDQSYEVILRSGIAKDLLDEIDRLQSQIDENNKSIVRLQEGIGKLISRKSNLFHELKAAQEENKRLMDLAELLVECAGSPGLAKQKLREYKSAPNGWKL